MPNTPGLSNNRSEVKLAMLDIFSKQLDPDSFSDKDMSKALRAQHMIRCDYRTCQKYRVEIIGILTAIRDQAQKKLDQQLKKKGWFETIMAGITKKDKGDIDG